MHQQQLLITQPDGNGHGQANFLKGARRSGHDYCCPIHAKNAITIVVGSR